MSAIEQVREHMKVIGADGAPIGTVDPSKATASSSSVTTAAWATSSTIIICRKA